MPAQSHDVAGDQGCENKAGDKLLAAAAPEWKLMGDAVSEGHGCDPDAVAGGID
jgi:hypothetical protein